MHNIVGFVAPASVTLGGGACSEIVSNVRGGNRLGWVGIHGVAHVRRKE